VVQAGFPTVYLFISAYKGGDFRQLELSPREQTDAWDNLQRIWLLWGVRRQRPGRLIFQVLRFRKLDEHRSFLWVQPAKQSFDADGFHCSTSGCALLRPVPDMQENTRPCSASRGACVVADDHAPPVQFITSPHLLGTAPIFRGAFRVKKLVVVDRVRIIHALHSWGELNVRQSHLL
jgi:hypothetical protein